MAKKNRKSIKRPTMEMPLVSVCTPTYNRRPFIPSMLKCFEHQIYPKTSTLNPNRPEFNFETNNPTWGRAERV